MATARVATTIHGKGQQPLYSSGDPCGRHAAHNFAAALTWVLQHLLNQFGICYNVFNLFLSAYVSLWLVTGGVRHAACLRNI